MANIFLAFLLFSVILLILGAEVFINFTYRGKLVTKVDILFFTVILYKDEKEKNQKKKKRRAKKPHRAIRYLLKNSTLSINSLNIPLNKEAPSDYFLSRANLSFLTLISLQKLSDQTKRLTVTDNVFIGQKDLVGFEFDLTLKTTALVLLIAYVIYRSKNKNRKDIKCQSQK